MRKSGIGHLFAFVAAAFLLLAPSYAHAHGGEKHHAAEPPAPPPTPSESGKLAAINARYLAEVKPVFKKKCFDCHSEQAVYPWYYFIPGVRQLVDHDIRTAREHMDMNADFPFKSHATPLKDLEAIEKAVTKGTMPPWRYRIIHRDSALNEGEKAVILRWAAEGKETLIPAP